MANSYYLLFAMLIIGGLFFVVLRRFKSVSKSLPYQLKEALLSPAERRFFAALQQASRDQFLVFSKVRMSDVIRTKKGMDAEERSGAWNKINQKHFDFVLCDPVSTRLAAVVELDDRSHRTNERAMKSDSFKNEVLQQVGLPLIRFEARANYSADEVRKQLMDALNEHVPW